MTAQRHKVLALGLAALVVALSLAPVQAQSTTAKPRVNINTASASELESLPRIGPKVAQRIVDFRTKNGNFKKVEEIMKVQGIGEKVFDQIKGLITVGAENAPKLARRPCPAGLPGRSMGHDPFSREKSHVPDLPTAGPPDGALFFASRKRRSLATARPRWLTSFLIPGGSSAKVLRRGA
jgi:competence protein ComEA